MPRTLKPHIVDTIEHKMGTAPIYLERNGGSHDNYDSHKGWFYSEFGGQRTKHYPTIAEAHAAAIALMDKLNDIAWVGVIGIQVTTPSGHKLTTEADKGGASVGIKFERFWYAVRGDGVQYQATWASAARPDRHLGTGPAASDLKDYRLDDARDWKPISVRKTSGSGYSAKSWYEYPPLTLPHFVPSDRNYHYGYERSEGTLYIAHDDAAWAMLNALAGQIEQLTARLQEFLDNAQGVATLVNKLAGLPLLAPPEHEAITEVLSHAAPR